MIVKTKSRPLQVLIKHEAKEELRHGKLTTHQTHVIIKTVSEEKDENGKNVNGEQIVEARAYCSENDNHSRLQGRKWGLQKAFENDLQHNLTKEERTELFKAVCPILADSKKKEPA